MEWLDSVIGALGVLGPATAFLWVRLRRRLRSARLPRSTLRHDPEDDGILELVAWSTGRRLLPEDLETRFRVDIVRQNRLFITDVELLAADLAADGRTGSIAWPVAMRVDSRESPETRTFGMTLAPADYSDAIALHRLAARRPDVEDRIRMLHRRGLEVFLAGCPPTSISAGVTVFSRRGRFLALRRSAAVTLFPNEWTPGIHETMKFADEPGAEEDFFATIRRGLNEELGLRPGDYSQPTIMNVAFALPAMAFGMNAFVRLEADISETEVVDRYSASHSSFEHDRVSWQPLTSATLDRFFRTGSFPGIAGSWFYATRYILRSLWAHRREWSTG